METVLRIQNINKHYPGFALENVSFLPLNALWV